MDDVNSLSLGYYPASSPDAPVVLGSVNSAYVRATFCEFFLYFQFGVMDDVNSLSLGYYPASSPDAPAVLGSVNSVYLSQCRLDSDQSEYCATFRLFKVGDVYNLSDLKKLVVHFGLVWNVVASRAGSSFRCNRYTRPGSSVRKVILRRTSPIVCGCECIYVFIGVLLVSVVVLIM